MPALSVLSCDPFALTIKTITLVTVAIVVLTSETYVRARVPSHQQSKFYALLLFSTLPMCLLGSTTDLIMIVLAFYFLSVTSYILTGYLRDDRRSVEAAIKYFLYGATLSAVMLYGVSWFYGLTGSTDLTEIATALLESESRLRPVLLPALIFVAAGLAFRIGAVPFHQWAPDAYEGAPTPISAFLSVGPTITGLAVVLRVLLTGLPVELEEVATDWRALLMALSTLTMTVGNLAA
ncbi:MAG: NADH:ubiquinone oxidoreductase subunit 2, partial [Chloroflexi bacterium]